MSHKLAPITIALGAYGRDPAFREAIKALTPAPVEFADIAPISRAFAPMVRELRFDISEMALMTFLQAKACGKALTLLPISVSARFQEAALLCRADDSRIKGPEDLVDRRVGVRAYGQTTAVWLRGILQERYGIPAQAIHWVTFEPAHVAEYADPDWARRAASGADMMALLKSGALDAVVVGNDVPDDPGLRTVFADPKAAGETFYAEHGLCPINHVVVAARPFMQLDPGFTGKFIDVLTRHLASLTALDQRAQPPCGAEKMRPSIELALRYATDQSLLTRPLTLQQVWA